MANDGIDRDEIYEVVAVVNGPLKMSAGKMGGQTLQAIARFLDHVESGTTRADCFRAWVDAGTRTIVKEATTPAIFQRVQDEIANGFLMIDEGHTEVDPGSATVFVTPPFLHKNRPPILDNKKVKLL